MVSVVRILITFIELWIAMEENAKVKIFGRRKFMCKLLNEIKLLIIFMS